MGWWWDGGGVVLAGYSVGYWLVGFVFVGCVICFISGWCWMGYGLLVGLCFVMRLV